jgi:uncharacterized cupredoxin-like copper-binding protein
MRSVRNGIFALTVVLLVPGLLFYGAGRGLAKQATPVPEQTPAGRPAHIHLGTCATLDPNPAFPLTNVAAPTGTAVGPADATPVETSVSTVAVDLTTLTTTDYSINVHLSQEEANVYIACGEIGGVLDGSGSLSIGLREQNDSGFSGVAFLTPNAADPTQTDVSVFLAEGLSGVAASPVATEEVSPEATEEESPEATEEAAAGEEVDVSLSEFTIDMPTELSAGSVTFNISNDGEFPHSFEIENEDMGFEEGLDANLEPGDSDTLTVDLEPGTYEVYCPVGNHREMGMELELTVS